MEINLVGKTAFITGGNIGIGRGVSLALARCGADVALTYFSHPEEGEATVKAIQIRLPDRALVPLLGALEDPDVSVVQLVIETLSHYQDPRITDFLVPFLSSRDTETASFAAQALGRNGDPKAEPALINILQETLDPFLKLKTAEALGNLRPNT